MRVSRSPRCHASPSALPNARARSSCRRTSSAPNTLPSSLRHFFMVESDTCRASATSSSTSFAFRPKPRCHAGSTRARSVRQPVTSYGSRRRRPTACRLQRWADLAAVQREQRFRQRLGGARLHQGEAEPERFHQQSPLRRGRQVPVILRTSSTRPESSAAQPSTPRVSSAASQVASVASRLLAVAPAFRRNLSTSSRSLRARSSSISASSKTPSNKNIMKVFVVQRGRAPGGTTGPAGAPTGCAIKAPRATAKRWPVR